MTAKELATALTGRKVGMEITSVEFDRAADAGLVVVFGYSDDNVEFRGAIDEEVGAWNGTTIHVTPDGLLTGSRRSAPNPEGSVLRNIGTIRRRAFLLQTAFL